jgi:hypothetical protein
MTADHFIDAKTEQMMRARIIELYDRHGLKAFRLPGVQQAIDLLLDADDSRTRLSPATLAEIVRAFRRRQGLPVS